MKIHYLQHAASEGPGMIRDWAAQRGHEISGTEVYLGHPFPPPDSFDLLLIMGGAMNIYQHRDFPWLPLEKDFIRSALSLGKGILGICLGAQLLADTLGGKVFQNPQSEIGWFPVSLTTEGRAHAFFRDFPSDLVAFHWHGDTFDLPPGCVPLARSEACAHQAFVHGPNVVALQFHIEVSAHDVDIFLGDSPDLGAGPFIQSLAEIRDCGRHLPATKRALWSLLDALSKSLPARDCPGTQP